MNALLQLPALICKAVVWLRNKLYDTGVFLSYRFGIPVISVGNITVGGTGKTPHTEYLIDVLSKDFSLAVLSRGYKRQSKGFQYVEIDDSTSKTGDEPLQIKRRYPDVVVAVDADRVQGIKRLQSDYPRLDLILLDDAFQHRRVAPSLNIVLVDYNRPVWNDAMLPAGWLRDCRSSLYRADIIVVTKCPANISEDEKRQHADKLRKYGKLLYFSCVETGKAYSLSTTDETAFDSSNLLAISGIANPAVFFAQIEKQYPEAVIERCAFPDHHVFSKKDIHDILKKAETHTVVTTEKDSVRLISYFHEAKEQIPANIYCIPIKVKIDDSDSFNSNIINHVRENKNNGRLYQN
jgi:tetraacyldisaccharide 4'-kinase